MPEREDQELEKLLATPNISPKSVRLFLSFKKDADGGLAGMIKEKLEIYGIEVFIAHEDIEPSVEWQGEIIRQIKGCDAFIPLLTNDFSESHWTDQEVGIAIANDKTILPLKIDLMPYGFMEKYQALKFDKNDPERSCSGIVDALYVVPFLKEKVVDCGISSLEKAWDFETAKKIIQQLNKYSENLSKEQVNEIIRVSAMNGQVYECFAAKPILKAIVSKYSGVIDRRISDKLNSRWL